LLRQRFPVIGLNSSHFLYGIVLFFVSMRRNADFSSCYRTSAVLQTVFSALQAKYLIAERLSENAEPILCVFSFVFFLSPLA